MLVLPGGFEPPILAEHGPKPCASAISPRERVSLEISMNKNNIIDKQSARIF